MRRTKSKGETWLVLLFGGREPQDRATKFDKILGVPGKKEEAENLDALESDASVDLLLRRSKTSETPFAFLCFCLMESAGVREREREREVKKLRLRMKTIIKQRITTLCLLSVLLY